MSYCGVFGFWVNLVCWLLGCYNIVLVGLWRFMFVGFDAAPNGWIWVIWWAAVSVGGLGGCAGGLVGLMYCDVSRFWPSW